MSSKIAYIITNKRERHRNLLQNDPTSIGLAFLIAIVERRPRGFHLQNDSLQLEANEVHQSLDAGRSVFELR